MSKRTTILILILAVITAGLLYIALMGSASKKMVVASPTPTPMSPNAKTTLSLEEAPASLSSTLSEHTAEVAIDSTNLVNGVQIELGYDPAVITNVSVAPGTFFKEPTVLIKNINTEDGRISYALTEQLDLKGHAGSGVVAFVYFDIKPGTTVGKTSLVFMPKTAVTSQGILESVLKKTSNYTLSITPVPGKAASTSAH